MGDDIEINVTETTNIIEITPQPNDQIVDIAVTDNAPNVEINVTPSVIEINVTRGSSTAIWGSITGNIDNQTDLATKFGLKADLVDGKVPSSQLPSYVDDVIEVANYAALPVIGESGKIYITIDNNHIFRWTGSTYVEITDNTAVWGAITGTLSSQTDLQSALNAKVPYTGASGNVNLGEYGLTAGFLGLDITPTSTPIGIGTIYWDAANRTAALIDGDGDTTLQIGQEERILVHNNTGSTLTDGQVVYVTGSTGELPSVSLANAGAEATSAATIGVVTESIANGADGFITTSGLIHGLNTLAFNEGDLLWLGTTSGTFTTTKPTSPNHLVLIGYVIKKSGGNGSILVKIQNTQELAESSDVLFNSLANNDVLTYESSSSLWKNKSLSTILGYTPANDSNVVHLTGAETITGTKSFNSTTGIGIRSNNSGSGYGVYSDNSSTGIAYYVANSGQGKGFLVANALSSLGNLFEGSYNGTQNFVVNYLGELTASKLIKSGGTSSQFLKADGSVDSSTYALTSQLHNAVTIGTANGLSLLTQVLSLGLSSSTLNGALSSTDWVTFNNKVESVAANAPLGSTGGKSPVISITQATTSSNGYLSSTDWNTFNGKQNALINPITGTGTSGYHAKFTGASTLGNSLIYDNGTNVGIGTTSPNTLLQIGSGGGAGATNSIAYLGGYSSGVSQLRYIMNHNGAANAGIGTPSAGGILFGYGLVDGTISGEWMRINTLGNVGIGTTSPDNGLLTILKATSRATESSYAIAIQSNTSNVYTELLLGTDDSVDCGIIQTAAKNTSFTTKKLALQPQGGNVLIGTSSSIGSGIFQVKTSSANNVAHFQNGTSDAGYGLVFLNVAGSAVGSIGWTNIMTSYNTTSDYRLKEDFKDYSGLDLISKIKTYDYKWKQSEDRMYGVKAHELQEVVPYAVTGEKDAEQMQSVDYSKLVPILVQAIQELKAEIDLLKTK